MTLTTTLGCLLDERARSLAGRDRERAALLDLVHDDRPLVMAVHGIAGIGKTAVLHAFTADAEAAGARAVLLDGREIEPSATGFVAALGAALDVGEAPLEATAAALGALAPRVVLIIDTYEVLALLDEWLSARLVPALPANVRVVVAGRTPPPVPGSGATGSSSARCRCRTSPRPTPRRSSLRRASILRSTASRAGTRSPSSWRSALRGRAAHALDDAAFGAIAEQLGRLYLDRLDPLTRRALAAASVTRRTTLSLLEAMLPEDPPWEAFERLRALPFVELGADGLIVHDTVHAVAGALLRATDPAGHRRYRVAAWNRLRAEVREAPHRDLWRYMADMLFLVDTPVVREFFFPAMVLDAVVERARPADWPAIAALAEGHASATTALEDWWRAVPHAFAVARHADGSIAGFSCVVERDDVSAAVVRRDPLAARWRDHLRRDPVPRANRVLLLRYMAVRGEPMTPSPALAALLLDLKRAYFALRPALRRTYAPAPLLAGADSLCALALGYTEVPGQPDRLPAAERLLYNDYGPGSIDGWLADLAARELLVEDATSVDAVRRELRLDGRRIDLTQLEFDVLRYLQQHEGRAVARDALLRDVWGYEWSGGSNVVEVAISALRKKLGARARALHTVRGVGYRLDPLA